MGKKKPKEPQEAPDSSATPASSDLFNKLFGNVSEQNANSSLFSDENPFRKKPLESGSSFGSTKNTENAGNTVSDKHDSGELKRKRSKETKSAIDSDDELEAGKKLKPQDDEAHDPDLRAQAAAFSKEVKVEDPDSRLQSIKSREIVNEDKEKRKKRKRDEVEKEWESKKYGAVEEAEDNGEGLRNKIVGTKRKTVDNPADMLVENEGFDDENKLLRTIFVGNLPLKVKKKTLLKEFKKFGEVESVRIRSVPILDVGIPFSNDRYHLVLFSTV